mmetsp:Transcript_63704/g.138605  ORF Transcript_63704/g.138605 Transcript_63704/m.138605 type:complete len:146 (+) Transcript_63704:105-542(+)
MSLPRSSQPSLFRGLPQLPRPRCLRSLLLSAAAALLLLAPSTQAVPAGLSLHGMTYTIEDIYSGVVEIETGSFIAVVNKEHKDAVLEEMDVKFGWKPKKKFSRMAMFAGEMNQEQVLWLLQHEDVQSLENDGKVRALIKEKGTEL